MTVPVIRIALVVLAYLLAYFLATYFGVVYGFLFPRSLGGGSFIPTSATLWLAGLPLAVSFFVVLFQVSIGKQNLWWWIGIALLPAILFEVLIDPLHIYFPIAIGFVGLGLGYLANKALHKLAPGFMAKI